VIVLADGQFNVAHPIETQWRRHRAASELKYEHWRTADLDPLRSSRN
jgi:hypothetical protein